MGWGDNIDIQLAIPGNILLPYNNNPLYNATNPIEISNGQNGAFVLEDALVACDNFQNYCYSSLKLTANTTWTSSTLPTCNLATRLTIENELFIPRNTTLIINSGEIYFGPNGRIVLEEGTALLPGAQLIINSSVLLSAVGDCMWKGIEVRGISTDIATNIHQCKIFVNSGATIEHAHNAITLGKWDAGYYSCYVSVR